MKASAAVLCPPAQSRRPAGEHQHRDGTGIADEDAIRAARTAALAMLDAAGR